MKRKIIGISRRNLELIFLFFLKIKYNFMRNDTCIVCWLFKSVLTELLICWSCENYALEFSFYSYYHTTVEEFVKLHEKEFDAIVISEVLEYMPFWGQKQFLKLCTSFCKVCLYSVTEMSIEMNETLVVNTRI